MSAASVGGAAAAAEVWEHRTYEAVAGIVPSIQSQSSTNSVAVPVPGRGWGGEQSGVHIHYRRFHIASLYVLLHGRASGRAA